MKKYLLYMSHGQGDLLVGTYDSHDKAYRAGVWLSTESMRYGGATGFKIDEYTTENVPCETLTQSGETTEEKT